MKEKFIIEYLILVSKNDCHSKNFFINHLSEIDLIVDNVNKTITYKTQRLDFTVDFELHEYNVKGKTEKDNEFKSFRLILRKEINIDAERDINLYTNLAETVVKCINKRISQNASINTLWNDISRSYSNQAYPLINEIENLMRKLITRFMLENIGLRYSKKNMPEIVVKKIAQREEQDPENNSAYIDDLYKTDFEHLAEALFRQYQDIQGINDELRKAEKDIDITKLKDLLPNSNWNLFFKQYIKQINEKQLKEYWASLSKLRNKIAHNRNISRNDLNEIKKLSAKLKSVIEEGLNNLKNINPSQVQQMNIIVKEIDNIPKKSEDILIICEGQTDEKIISILLKKLFLKYNQKFSVKIFVVRGKPFINKISRNLLAHTNNQKIIVVVDSDNDFEQNQNFLNQIGIPSEHQIIIEPAIEAWLINDKNIKKDKDFIKNAKMTIHKSGGFEKIIESIDIEELRIRDNSFDKFINSLIN